MKIPLNMYAFTPFEDFPSLTMEAQTEEGKEPKLLKIGSFSYTNRNGQNLAAGALNQWLAENDSAPIFAQHNKASVPAGRWEDLTVKGRSLYGRPVFNATSLASDIKAAVESGDFKGVSWGIKARDSYSIKVRRKKEGETDFLNSGKVLVYTDGILSESSFVVDPADPSAYFRSKKLKSSVITDPDQMVRNIVIRNFLKRK